MAVNGFVLALLRSEIDQICSAGVCSACLNAVVLILQETLCVKRVLFYPCCHRPSEGCSEGRGCHTSVFVFCPVKALAVLLGDSV